MHLGNPSRHNLNYKNTIWSDAVVVYHKFDSNSLEQPPYFTFVLPNHQLEGVYWMIQRETDPPGSFPMRGGILADEMGLGKTIEVLSLLAFEKYKPEMLKMKSTYKNMIHSHRGKDYYLLSKMLRSTEGTPNSKRFYIF